MRVAAPVFRFEADRHEYFLDDVRIPSITQLIEKGGLLGPGAEFYTEASRDRGIEVHRLCSEWDFGTLDLLRLESPQRGYVLAYVAACQALKPAWDAIEEADVHPKYRFAGRIDRAGVVFGRQTVTEIKSGGKLPAKPITFTDHEGTVITLRGFLSAPHAVQLALAAMLRSVQIGLPAEQFKRLAIYVKHTGKFTVEEYADRRDFDAAKRLIKEFCR